MNIVKINKSTLIKLTNGNYSDELPDLYSLNEVIEINSWHDNHNVFDHTLEVIENLQNLLELLCKKNPNLQDYFSQKIDNHSRYDLLLIATILHDIGKRPCLITNDDKTTRCPGHEAVGSVMSSGYQHTFDLTDNELKIVKDIILKHSLIIDIQSQIISKDFEANYFMNYLKIVDDIAIELLILHLADLKASDFNKFKPEEFKARKAITERFLKNVINKL